MGRLDAAYAAAKESLAEQPSNHRIASLNRLCDFALHASESYFGDSHPLAAEALQYCHQALQDSPRNAVALMNVWPVRLMRTASAMQLGLVALGDKKYDAAIDLLKRSFEQAPRDKLIVTNLAVAYSKCACAGAKLPLCHAGRAASAK